MKAWRALRTGESVHERRRQLERAHEEFTDRLAARESVEELRARFSELRPTVFDSWMRSRELTVHPDRLTQQAALSTDELLALRRGHPLGRVLPVVQRLLIEEAEDAGFIVAIGDAAGRLLWIDGDATLRSRAEDMGFALGTDWSEAAVGTSAPGSAITLDHAFQVLGAEHYSRAVHEWSCTAAPIHDPESGSIIGVIDVTGGDSAAAPQLLPLVEATRAAVEAELKLVSLRARMEEERTRHRSDRRPPAPAEAAPRLVLLGRDPALLECGNTVTPVTRRHAEILLALEGAPGGLTAAALAEDVYGDRDAQQTLRAEVVRLRRTLREAQAPLAIESRPYRLSGPQRLRTDAHESLEAIGRGAHRLALASYEGPVLPESNAATAQALRADVDATLREAMLQAASQDTLFEYAHNWAPQDEDVWETLLRTLPPLSPKRARVVARLEALRPVNTA